jgi:hypothetical protein
LLGKEFAGLSAAAPRSLLVGAVAALVGAATLSLIVNAPRDYRVFSNDDVRRMAAQWEGDAAEARLIVARFAAEQLMTAYELNNRKSRLLQLAVAAEVFGVGLIATAALVGLLTTS